MIHDNLRNNPLRHRDDMARAFEDIASPLYAHLSRDGGQINLKSIAAHYQDRSIGLEGLARSFYGTVPFILGGFDSSGTYADLIETAFGSGTDPDSPDYWGDPFFYNQNFIELGSLALHLCLISQARPEAFTRQMHMLTPMLLPLKSFNDVKNNNQLFFKLFIFLALNKHDPLLVDTGDIDAILAMIDRSYIGDGFYNDGLADDPNRSVDYYNAMAFHFYGLIFAQLEGAAFPMWGEKFRKRAQLFAHQFTYWFDERGRAIPFGRSLTYRSAQSAFWSALAFANEEALPWGQIKTLVLGNLRCWFQSPMFNQASLLTPGYAYPNLNMAEEYNSDVSSYWALKPFLLLALEDDRPFWQADEKPVQRGSSINVQKPGRQIVCNAFGADHAVLLNAGHWRKSNFQHIEEKYAKFAYSSHFGFNVSTGNSGLDKKAPDNTLLFSDDGRTFKERGETFDHEVGRAHIASSFRPWNDVVVRSWICPLNGSTHLRIHHIKSGRDLICVEGGFALPRTDANYPSVADADETEYFGNVLQATGTGHAMICDKPGLSGIVDGSGARTGSIIVHAPNSNLLHRRTVIPVLESQITKGETYFVTLVMGYPDRAKGRDAWRDRPCLKTLVDKVPDEIMTVFQSAMSREPK